MRVCKRYGKCMITFDQEKKYCRYCAYCSYGDIPYCTLKDMTMSEEKIKQLNNCKEFILNEIDILNPDHIYKPRPRKKKQKQPSIFDFNDTLC